jgi:hypothetical protein
MRFSPKRFVTLLLLAFFLICATFRFLTGAVGIASFPHPGRTSDPIIFFGYYLSPWMEFSLVLMGTWALFLFSKWDKRPDLQILKYILLALFILFSVDIGYKTFISYQESPHFAEHNRWPFAGLPFDLRMNKLKQFE